MARLRISAGKVTVEVDLRDTPTARALAEKAPFESTASTWGDEVYFSTPVKARLESDAQQVVAPGTVCFWTQGDSIALPFGYQPLKRIKAGDRIRVENA